MPLENETMPRKRLPRNAPCPCGSGKKYKKCCYNKGFEWVEDEEGGVAKSVPMSEDLAEVLQQLRQTFINENGREPGPDDRLFPDMPHPEHLEAMMVEGMKAAGLDPAFIHAFETTGLLVTEQNRHLIPDTDLDEWHAAIEEYEAKHSLGERSPKFPLGTVTLYGPDDKTTTKITAGVITSPTAEPILKRWVATDVTTNPKIQREIQEFFAEHQVKSVAASAGNMGCPHEEGEDFPEGEDCPFCPFWNGKQGSDQWF
jgi:hypothetical protein